MKKEKILGGALSATMFLVLVLSTFSPLTRAGSSVEQSQVASVGRGVERVWSDLPKEIASLPPGEREVPRGYEVDIEELRDLKRQPFAHFEDESPVIEEDAATLDPQPLAPNISRGFEGLDNLNQPDGYLHRPPDPIMAVGFNHVGVMVNSEFAFYTKDGTLVVETSFSSWWSDIYSGASTPFDPRIAYDHHADRWLMMALVKNYPDSWYLLSVSQTSDPTGAWWNYKLDGTLTYGGLTWADYPDLGFDGITDGAIYITSNQFTFAADIFRTAMLNILPKSALYSGAGFSYWRVTGMKNADNSSVFTLRAAHTFGNPGGEFLINSKSDGGNTVTLWRVNATFPPDPVELDRQATTTIGSYSPPPEAQQMGGSATLDTIDNRIYNCMYRNGYLYAAFTEAYNWGSGPVAAIRYLKIDTSTNSADLDVRYGADGYYYWFPAIYTDSLDNIAIVFARSSPTEYAGIRYTSRKTTDTTTQPSALLKAGETYITGWRWGDYFGIGNDPSDGSKVWIYGEWAKDCSGVNSDWDWGTWVGEVSLGPWGDWEHYHNYAEIVNTLLYLNSTYPNIVDVFSIGESWQDRDVYCLRLTNENITHPKPKVFFVGYHHAREPISAEQPLYFAVEAAIDYGTNTTTTHMLNYSEIYIVPALNVDAFDVVKQNEWQRKNVHPFDEDEDSLLDEDPPDDEDGDGYIEDLWQWNGTDWVFIRWEGIDDDGDGLLNEDWVGGVDLNRNYGYEWNASVDSGSPYPQDEDYRGPSPFSEPETQAIRDLALQHAFKYAISFHSGADNIIYPWGYITTPTPGDQIFREVASNLSALVGAPYGQSGAWYTTSGVWDDWMYGNRSTFALTCEIYTNSSAWQYEPGPDPDTLWEKGVFQFFNPDPRNIETVIQRWLPVFTYITNRSITEAYDVATANVTTPKTIVGQGFSMRINVTVTNQGDFTETFNVTAYANTTVIDTPANITLISGNSTTVTFTWNTTSVAKGNYTVTAAATPLPGETDTTDNTYINGEVYVGIPGDLDADGDVDPNDFSIFAGAYGTSPPSNPNCDLDSDGYVSPDDFAIFAGNYGKTDP